MFKPVRCTHRNCPQIKGALIVKRCVSGRHNRYRYLFDHNVSKSDHCSQDCTKCRKAKRAKAQNERQAELLGTMRRLLARGFRSIDEFAAKVPRGQAVWLLTILRKQREVEEKDGGYYPLKKKAVLQD